MREILFRGKRVIDGKWVESCCPLGEMHSGTVTYDFDPNTVCQYTGLTDKNGRNIFEGDIVLFTDNIKIKGTTSHTSKVEWNTEIGGFVFHAECIGYYNVNPSQIVKYNVEVIDNIFDNQDLMKG